MTKISFASQATKENSLLLALKISEFNVASCSKFPSRSFALSTFWSQVFSAKLPHVFKSTLNARQNSVFKEENENWELGGKTYWISFLLLNKFLFHKSKSCEDSSENIQWLANIFSISALMNWKFFASFDLTSRSTIPFITSINV